MTPPASSTTSDAVTAATRGWSVEDAIPGVLIQHPGGRTIDEAEHVWLAWITNNISDVHGNAHAASHTEWGQPLVLGMLSVAIVVGLAEPAPGPAASMARGLGQGWDSIVLERPVVAGSTLSAASRIEHVETSADGRDVLVQRTIIGRDQTGAVIVRIRETRHLPLEDDPEAL